MKVNILVEGQTEEMFVKESLYRYLIQFNIFIQPVIISTKTIRNGTKFKGGLTEGNFNFFIQDLKKLIHSTPNGVVTTFIDYYKLPESFPLYVERLNLNHAKDRVDFLEQALHKHLESPQNFIPYIQLHEFEALLFAHKDGFSTYIDSTEGNLKDLLSIIETNNPEDINERPETAPSKRILNHYPSYDKIAEGNLMLLEIGIERILEKCPHFKEWIDKIIAFSKK